MIMYFSKIVFCNVLGLLFMLTLSATVLTAATAATGETYVLQGKESVLLYVDKIYQGACKDIKSTYKNDISKKKIKWKIKKAKKNTFTELAHHIEKELIQAKSDIYIIALSNDELWNFKKNQTTELNLDDYQSSIEKIVKKLKAAGKKIILCTPHQISAGQNLPSNERLSKAAERISLVGNANDVHVAQIYISFDKKNKSGDPGKHNKGITTKDGLKLNGSGENIIISLIGKALGLNVTGPGEKASIDRKLAKGDKIAIIGPAQLRVQAQELSMQIKDHYRQTMGVEAPHVVGLKAGKQFWYSRDEIEKFFETQYHKSVGSLKPSIVVIYPGMNILGSRKYFNTLNNGEYKEHLRTNIRLVQSVTNATIFICTPLLWKEDDAANKIVIDGANYKSCQLWADQTKAVANEFKLGIIDMHMNCLDYIEKHGVNKANFAGRRSAFQGVKSYNNLDWGDVAKDMYLGSICEALNFDYTGTKKE